ncbi:unnamed protein product [Gadus morhua 'NCC']
MEVKGGPLPTARNQLAVVCCPGSGGASRRWCCPGSGQRGTISPRQVHLPAALVPRQRVAGSGQRSGTSATWHWCLAAVVPRGGGASSAGLWRETIAGNNPFFLHVAVHVLQGVKAEVPFPPIPPQPWLR